MLSACTTPTQPNTGIVRANLFAHPPRTILILPPINNTTRAEAPAAFHITAIKPLVEQGYYTFPPLLTMAMFTDRTRSEGALSSLVSPQQLGELFGVDAILYITITEWNRGFQLIIPVSKVTAEYALVDTASGETLWKHTEHREAEESTNTMAGAEGGAGAIGAAVAGAVGDMQRSAIDPRLPARRVNKYAFQGEETGLPFALIILTTRRTFQSDGKALISPN